MKTKDKTATDAQVIAASIKAFKELKASKQQNAIAFWCKVAIDHDEMDIAAAWPTIAEKIGMKGKRADSVAHALQAPKAAYDLEKFLSDGKNKREFDNKSFTKKGEASDKFVAYDKTWSDISDSARKMVVEKDSTKPKTLVKKLFKAATEKTPLDVAVEQATELMDSLGKKCDQMEALGQDVTELRGVLETMVDLLPDTK